MGVQRLAIVRHLKIESALEEANSASSTNHQVSHHEATRTRNTETYASKHPRPMSPHLTTLQPFASSAWVQPLPPRLHLHPPPRLPRFPPPRLPRPLRSRTTLRRILLLDHHLLRPHSPLRALPSPYHSRSRRDPACQEPSLASRMRKTGPRLIQGQCSRETNEPRSIALEG